MLNQELQKKVDRAIRFLRSIPLKEGEQIEIAYSGGKDSDVILQLAKEAGIPYRAIYKKTTIDPIGTTRHAMEMGAEIVKPKESFYKLISRAGYPNRVRRFCCQKIKEYKILDKAVIGVRRSESAKRAKRYTEPTECRYFGSKKDEANHVQHFFLILDWEDSDVEEFIMDRGIRCAPVYYDENGKFHVERRLGCIGCPLQSNKRRRESFMNNPQFLKLWLNGGGQYYATHPEEKSSKYFKDQYERMVCDLFYDDIHKFMESKESMFNEQIDYKKFLEDYFKIKL